jgi:Diacylglycerol acyltransferase
MTMTTTPSKNTAAAAAAATTYFRFSLSELPDEHFSEDVPVEEWLGTSTDTAGSKSKAPTPTTPTWLTTTSSKDGFEPGELQNHGNIPTPIPTDVEIERMFGIALYMIGNVAPFALPLLALLAFVVKIRYVETVFYGLVLYIVSLFVVEYFYFVPKFNKYFHSVNANASKTYKNKTTDKVDNDNEKTTKGDDNIRRAQYLWTERHTTQYLSMSYVWPSTLKLDTKPKQQNAIFCVIPHGLAPYGIVGYPVWSKLWNSLTCRWTCAPVILTLPLIGTFMKKIGYIPAKSKNILKVLEKGENNVGIILDGIEGMFKNTNPESQKEVGCILSRKGIIKIALKSGTPIIPVYGFGHTNMYTVWVDPFGILQFLSLKLGVSITPFFGRWGWPLGPPHRQVVTMCLGTPIVCPKVDEPSQSQIDEYHQKLLDGFQRTFNDHKVGFYGKTKGIDKELVFVK